MGMLMPQSEASNLKKMYVNIAKEGQKAQTSDIPMNWGSISTELNKYAHDYAHGKTAVLFNGAQKVESDGRKAVRFNGSNQGAYVDYGKIENVTNMSITHWIKPLAFQSGDHKLVPVSEGFNTQLQNLVPLTYFSDGTTWYTFKSTTTLEVGKWYHLTWVFNNGVAQLYINGQKNLEQTMTFTKIKSISGFNGKIAFGSRYYVNNTWIEYFNGEISDASVWNISLTPEQAQSIYKDGIKGNEQGLVGYWRFGE